MQKELIDKNPLLKLSFEFSLMILQYCDLLDQQHKYTINKQLIRSGTSIGANSMEAQNAESKTDFVHKIKIAANENYPDTNSISNKLTELQKIINTILGTSKRKASLNEV